MVMREIKFRVYDIERKIMRRVTCLYSENQVEYRDGLSIIQLNRNEGDEFELMQYTGLRDKNGVEIYEGDILNIEAVAYGRNMRAIVFYSNGGFMLRWEDGYESYIQDWADDIRKDGEVIGNICDNPELVEEFNKEKRR